MSVHNPESNPSGPLFVPKEWYGHEAAAEEDQRAYEEAITAAAYDNHVEKKLGLVIRSDPPEMSRGEFDKLRRYIEAEYQLQGINVRRAIGRGARQLREKQGIKRIAD